LEEDTFLSLFSILQITSNTFSAGMAAGIAVVLILLFCSAMISGSEVAFFSLSPQNIHKMNQKASRSSLLALSLLKMPEKLLAIILIANNFINVGIVIISNFVMKSIFDFSNNQVLGFIIQVVIITFLLLLFGEIVPKIYANRIAPRFATIMAAPLNILGKLFQPLVFILVRSTNLVNKRLASKRKNISMDDISEALNLTTGVVTDEKKMLKGIVKFSNLEVSEIMKPRMDVTAVEIDTPIDELTKIIIESGFSRIPVFEETSDNVKGILYVKDLLPHLGQKKLFKWQTLIREPFFVPETKKINDMLKEFQQMKIHLAIVVDEYGGTEGIVTMEDILEEVVGEITDESDEAEEFYKRIDKRTFVFDGKTQLNDFFKITEIEGDIFDDVKGDAETIAGLILELQGDFPKVNDIISCKNIRFTILSMESRRIKEIKVYINGSTVEN